MGGLLNGLLHAKVPPPLSIDTTGPYTISWFRKKDCEKGFFMLLQSGQIITC